MTELCGVTYERPRALDPQRTQLQCQYILGHPVEHHSWYAIEQQDRVDAEKRQAEQQRKKAQANAGRVKETLEEIEKGLWDSYIEAMLSALHDRKRTIRNVRGFPNLERRRKGA